MRRNFWIPLAAWLLFSATQAKLEEYPEDDESRDKLLASIIRARNASRQSLRPEEQEAEPKIAGEKKARTAIVEEKEAKDESDFPATIPKFRGRGSLTVCFRSAGLTCCGSRFSSVPSVRPDNGYNRIPSETGRYPSNYASGDRYNWQSYNGRPTSAGSGGSGGSGGRPGTYGHNYPGTGVYGGSQPGDRYLPSPARPNAGYGGYGPGRPGGYGSGVSGTFSDGSEFDGPEEPPSYPDGPPQHPNIQAQKAVALKALAGVALIGAAAALASNPVLLPLSFVSGRRKRSAYPPEAEPQLERIINSLTDSISQAYGNVKRGQKVVVSPRCVARMTCDIQKAYISDLKTNPQGSLYDENVEHRFTNLIKNSVLDSSTVNPGVKKLIKLAIVVGSKEGNCSVFPCNFISKG